MALVTLILKEAYQIDDKNLNLQLNRLGFIITNTLESVGSIIGEIDNSKIDLLKDLDAVAWVEA